MPRKKRCRRVCEEPDFPVFRPAGRVSGGHVLATVDDEIAARQKSEHVESVAANGFVDARFRRHGRVGGDARAYKGCVFVCGNIDCLVFGRIH